MANSGFIQRFTPWLSQQPSGRLFTIDDVLDAVNDGADPDQRIGRATVQQNLTRLARRSVGITRNGQGLYQWVPPVSRRKSPEPPTTPPTPRGPRIRSQDFDAPALAIASPGAFVDVVQEPAPEPARPKLPTPEQVRGLVAADAAQIAARTMDPTPAAAPMKRGEPMILTYLASVGPRSFLAEHDETRQVYRVTEVDSE